MPTITEADVARYAKNCVVISAMRACKKQLLGLNELYNKTLQLPKDPDGKCPLCGSNCGVDTRAISEEWRRVNATIDVVCRLMSSAAQDNYGVIAACRGED